MRFALWVQRISNFEVQMCKQAWNSLGMSDVIDEAAGVDRSGSVVLEEFLRQPSDHRSHSRGRMVGCRVIVLDPRTLIGGKWKGSR